MSKEKEDLVAHKNIYAALSAFQGENPEIKRTKHVEFSTSKGQKVDYWYAPLDEVLSVVRPLLAKHGLAITWEEKSEGKMVCALYHENYAAEYKAVKDTVSTPDNTKHTERLVPVETNVLRSMPITVKRSGDMKDVGSDSTYARRYTLSEVLGIASDDDRDVQDQLERTEALENFALKQAKQGIVGAKDKKTLESKAKYLKDDLSLLEQGKPGKLGFTKEQYDELLGMCAERLQAITDGEVDAEK